MKGILKHKHKGPGTQKREKIELPDDYNTGDIIYAITKAMKIFDYHYCMDEEDCFEIDVEDGRIYYCYETVPNVYHLYVEYVDEDGFEYCQIANFNL